MKLEDFWKNHVVTDSGCWLWNMARNHQGYGRVVVFMDGERRTRRAHRVAWELSNGAAIPPGLVVMHSCDNPPCICPDHLSVGSHKENSDDKVMKGRWRAGGSPGELNGSAVLTREQVLEARRLHAAGSISYAELGRIYGVTRQGMRLAIVGRNWNHL